MNAESKITLLTGATGFVGSALLDALRRQRPIRCLVRDGSKIEAGNQVEVVEADLAEPLTLPRAFVSVDSAFYLVHSMESGSGGFAEADREAAENFSAAAQEGDVRRVIYLGGIGGSEEADSEHLESRRQVEEILYEAAPEFVALRASMVVGAGSASFLSMVQLVDRMPVLSMPSWRDSKSQPVAIEDVVRALVEALEVPTGRYEIAGPDTITFERMTEVVAGALGKKHRSFPVPFSSSKLEGAAVSAITDADSELLEPLMEGLHSDLLVERNSLTEVFGVEPTPFAQATEEAITEMRTAGSIR